MSNPVVFDSNVWEQIADEAKRAVASPAVQALYTQITTQAITPFFFEGIVNLEAIPKKARKAYLQGYRPSIMMTVDEEVESQSRGTPASDIPEYLEATVEKAAVLGLNRPGFPRHLFALK